MPMENASGPAYLKSEAALRPRRRGPRDVVGTLLHEILEADEKSTVVESIRSDGGCG